MITGAAFLGLEATIDFKVPRKILFLWRPDDERDIAVLPEVESLRDLKLACIRGADEDDSLCLSLPEGFATQIITPGGHKLEGDHRALAGTIERLFQ